MYYDYHINRVILIKSIILKYNNREIYTRVIIASII